MNGLLQHPSDLFPSVLSVVSSDYHSHANLLVEKGHDQRSSESSVSGVFTSLNATFGPAGQSTIEFTYHPKELPVRSNKEDRR